MSNKKSFGFFYKEKSNNGDEHAEFVAHINVWNVSDKSGLPFIDFGLLIKNYKALDSVVFTAPFQIDSENVDDLSHILKENEIQLIFNNSKFSYKQIENSIYAGYNNEENKTVLLLPIKNDEGKFLQHIIVKENNSSFFQLKVDFTKCKNLPCDIETVYLRFRILKIDSKKLLSTLSTKNNYLESAFTERQILDFKLNNARTIDRFELDRFSGEGYTLARFSAIHLFVMVPSDYEITTWGDFSECRQLEKGEWDNYLNNCVSGNNIDISAYHWKQKKSKDNPVDEFAQLIKMEHKSTNLKLILIYCVIVIILGSLGSGLLEIIKCIFDAINLSN